MERELPTAQGLWLGRLEPLPEPEPDDLVLVPGGPAATHVEVGRPVLSWLRRAAEAGARVTSVCTGAFVLGAASLLDGRACTTHWSRLVDLTRRFRRARVLSNRLFVTDGNITSSAGIASGIDMTLALVEEHHGPRAAALTAREMVVYVRRDGAHRQESVYLDYRGHLNQGVHRAQDYLTSHPEDAPSLAKLARLSAMSVRSLTRQFRLSTGVSVHAFTTRVRLERARDLMRSPELTLAAALGGTAATRIVKPRAWPPS